MSARQSQAEKLKLVDISKTFPGVKALDGVNISLAKGSVHAVVGENGAGKSTLMKIINGLYPKDAGQIFLDGREVTFTGPKDSAAAGIAMIYQELNFFPDLSIEENLFMSRLPGPRGFVSRRHMREQFRALAAEYGLSYRPEMKIKELSVSDIQMLEIVKAVAFKAEIIIMDEPTSSISSKDVENLFATIRRLQAEGISVLYISHKMEEIFAIADYITVLRDGRSVAEGAAEEFTPDSLITHMVGRPIENVYPKTSHALGEVVLQAEKLCGSARFADVSFHIRRGEIVGFAGLVGAGRTEVARAIFGLDPLDSGRLLIEGRPFRLRTVSDAIRGGLLMLSEDRKREGIVGVRNLIENITLASHRVRKGGFIRLKKEEQEARRMAGSLNVRAANLRVPISTLSGGNQQKVLLARWLLLEAKVLLFDEPTRGIDVGAKFEIYQIMQRLVQEKRIGILMISSELPELIGMCDRIYVMNKGQIRGCLERAEFSQENVMRLATMQGKA